MLRTPSKSNASDRAKVESDFRVQLRKIMPGYNWTVHKSISADIVLATGIQSSGFNRLSTLRVTRRDINGSVSYEAKSAGYGTRSPWLHTVVEGTLARALRQLQNHYQMKASIYRSAASDLETARKNQDDGGAS